MKSRWALIFSLLIMILSSGPLSAHAQSSRPPEERPAKADPFPWHRITQNDKNDNDPALAYNSQRDEYLVVWIWEYANSNWDNVMGQRITASGEPVGGSFAIGTGWYLHYPAVAYDSIHDEYLVTYTTVEPTELYAQMIEGDGTLKGNRVLLESLGPGQVAQSSITFNPNAINSGHLGEYLVAYAWSTGVVAKHVSTEGNADVEEHVISNSGFYEMIDVVYNPTRRQYLAAYAKREIPANPVSDILARRMDENGNLLSTEVYIALDSRDTGHPQVALSDHDYLIVYTAGSTSIENDDGIYGRFVSYDGNASTEFEIAGAVTSDLGRPAVTYTPDYGYLITWDQSNGGVQGSSNLYGRYVRSGNNFIGGILAIDEYKRDQFSGDVACSTRKDCAIADVDWWYDQGNDAEITVWSIEPHQVFLPLAVK